MCLTQRKCSDEDSKLELGGNRFANLRRYLVRTLFQRRRAGNLDGNRDSVKWLMIRWILFVSPRNMRRYRQDLPKAGLPCIELRNMRELNRLYDTWGLTRDEHRIAPPRG